MANPRSSINVMLVVCIFALVLISGCGKLSNVIELNFPKPNTSETPPSNSFVGLTATGGTKTSGQYRIEAGISNQVVDAVKVNGSFKFYGGIQGEGFSR